LSRAVTANTLFPPGIEEEEEGACYNCLIPEWTKQFSGHFEPGPRWDELKKSFCTKGWKFLAILLLFLFKGGKYLVVDVGLPIYDVVTDWIAAYNHFQNGDIYYCFATIVFIVLPFCLLMTIGDGWSTLKKAAEASHHRCGKVLRVSMTILSFCPGFTWLPPATLPLWRYKNAFRFGTLDKLYGQNVHSNKMFEMYGENGPQFMLQVAIILKKNEDLEPQKILEAIFKNQAILTSLLSLLKRSVSIYLELAPRQKSGKEQHRSYVPYTNWKNSLIVGSMILLTVTPRVLSLAVYFGSCFPMFGKDNQGMEMVLGFRLGLVLFIVIIFVYGLISTILGYCLIIKPGKIRWSELILSLLTAIIGPCLIFQEKSKVLLLSSIASIFSNLLLLISLLVAVKINTATWNEDLSPNQVELYLHFCYVLIPWLLLSMIASWFLEEYSDLEYRFAVSEDLYCDEKKFVHACRDGHLAIVKTLIDSSDKKILNQVDKNGWTGLHLACLRGRLDVVQFLVDQMDNKQMNINVTTNGGVNALVHAIQHEEIAKVLLQTGKLDLENMRGVSEFVKNPDGSIDFKFRGYNEKLYKVCDYVVKMNSPIVVASIKKL